MTINILRLDGSDPRKCGQQHGEELREQIREIAEIRLGLMRQEDGGFKSNDEVFDLAKAHLPILEKFDRLLFDELIGIADGSGLSAERIVVLNNYTDMRDIKPRQSLDQGGCSVMYVPTNYGPILGQTWDIHGSAYEYVRLLRIRGDRDQEVLLFTIAGCLGMTGLSSNGVGITINNLASTDAKVGIVWPALVRKVLQQPSAEKGRDVVLHAPLGSGHHYTIADEKDIFGIETSGTKKKVTQTDAQKIHFHTNHCLDPEMAKTHTVRNGSTTFERYESLKKIIADHVPSNAEEMFEALGAVSIARDEKIENQTATCGAFVMDIAKRQVLACKGPPSSRFNNSATTLELKR